MTIELIPIANIVDKKRGNNKEYFINFFEKCNLSCGFCWQNHNDYTGHTDIIKRAKQVIQAISTTEYSTINVMGGELFADFVTDEIFKEYIQFVRYIHDYHPTKQYEINFVTNLVFDNVERVRNLYDSCIELGYNVGLTTSYDPVGRFNKQTLDIFLTNLDAIGGRIKSISVVMTRQNIEKIMSNNGDDTFANLYNKGYVFYFDYYSPEKNWKLYRPSNTLVVDFLLHLYKHYPRTNPIDSLLKNKNHELTTGCRASYIILPTGETGSCKILTQELNTNISNIHDLETAFVRRNDCLTCEFFKQCNMSCFLHSSSEYMSEDELSISECEFKRIYRTIYGHE